MCKEQIIKDGAINEYVLDDFSKGYSQVKDNCWNYSIFAQNPNVDIFTNEFNAGFVQGKIQGKKAIKAARDNTWRNFLICGTPQDNISITIPDGALEVATKSLYNNYKYLYQWLKDHEGERIATNIRRLLFRMAGIYAGVKYDKPSKVTFEMLDLDKMEPSELLLGGYDAPEITFMDIYLINAQSDMFDVVSDDMGLGYGEARTDAPKAKKPKMESCSAFVKYAEDGEMYITHVSWCGFYTQTCTVTYAIGDDFVTQNAYSQGQFGSNEDFGFNKNGIAFNETTHAHLYNESKELGIWITWRSAAAEMFATSIEDFYDHISIDNTGTYLNGYMLLDVNRGLTGIVEMSFKRFVLFVSDGKKLTVTDSTGQSATEKDYDPHLITPTHIFGINYPISRWVTYDLQTIDTRPMRRVQFFNRIDTVKCIETAKALITYTNENEPLSIYGRWDLGYGATEFSKIRPDGSVDAKAVSASMIRDVLKGLKFTPNKDSDKVGFWMKFGTPYVHNRPFIWSQSMFKDFKGSQEEDFVPDVLDGNWNLMKLFMD